jgi:hypothetical protein
MRMASSVRRNGRPLQEVRERAADVNEVLSGYRSGAEELAGPGEPRPEYAPGVPLMRRYAAKAAERGVSVRTVKRWVAASHREREAALAGELPTREAGSGGLGRADPRWAEMALEIMGEHKDESTPGKAKILQSVGPRLAARYPGEEICLPKRSTAYRWLAELERRRPTFGVSGKRRRDIAGRPVAAYGKLRPTRPGEYLLMDTTRLDVFALDQLTFRWVQPELSVAMDWYSRCITGLRVTPVSTKSMDVAATLFQAYRPRPAGADWPAHAAWPDHGIPRGIVLDRDAIEGPMAEAARQGGAASPALVPETLVVDHGKVYVSEHITSVCQRRASRSSPRGCARAGIRGRGTSGRCGHIGSLMTLVSRGCQRAIRTGAERLDTEVLDQVKNDAAAESARAQLEASLTGGRLTSRPRPAGRRAARNAGA